jgi:hypothetical protein
MEAPASAQAPQGSRHRGDGGGSLGSLRTAPTTYWVALAAAAAVVIGSFGTWATALGGLLSKSGTEGDGVLTLVLAVVALLGLWAFWREPRRWAAVGVLVLGVLIFAIGIYDLVDIENTADVSAGWGLYLVVAASAILGPVSFDLTRRFVRLGLPRSTNS